MGGINLNSAVCVLNAGMGPHVFCAMEVRLYDTLTPRFGRLSEVTSGVGSWTSGKRNARRTPDLLA